MKLQSAGEKAVIQPEILIWHGTPSDHSGSYHVILCAGLDGIPVEVSIEYPDCDRLEIPGLIDSGWDPEPEKVVAEFFESAKTSRPQRGVCFNNTPVEMTADLAAQLRSFCPELEKFFNDPSDTPSNLDFLGDSSLLIYSRIGNHLESSFYQCHYQKEGDMMGRLRDQFSTIKQFLSSGSNSDAFIQFVTSKDYLRVTDLSDLFCWWLWDTSQKLLRRVTEG